MKIEINIENGSLGDMCQIERNHYRAWCQANLAGEFPEIEITVTDNNFGKDMISAGVHPDKLDDVAELLNELHDKYESPELKIQLNITDASLPEFSPEECEKYREWAKMEFKSIYPDFEIDCTNDDQVTNGAWCLGFGESMGEEVFSVYENLLDDFSRL